MNKEKVAQWMIDRSYATGHGDTIEDLLKELEWQVAEKEREVCASICDGISDYYETRTDLNQTQKQVGQLAAEVCGVRIRERE